MIWTNLNQIRLVRLKNRNWGKSIFRRYLFSGNRVFWFGPWFCPKLDQRKSCTPLLSSLNFEFFYYFFKFQFDSIKSVSLSYCYCNFRTKLCRVVLDYDFTNLLNRSWKYFLSHDIIGSNLLEWKSKYERLCQKKN